MNRDEIISLTRPGIIVDVYYDRELNLVRLTKVEYDRLEDIFEITLEYVGMPTQIYADKWEDSDTVIELKGKYEDYKLLIASLEDFLQKSADKVFLPVNTTIKAYTNEIKNGKRLDIENIGAIVVPKYAHYSLFKFASLVTPKILLINKN